MPTGGREPKRKRPAAPLDGGGWEVSGSGGGVQEAASSGWGSWDMAPSSDMMVEDADVLDCDVCFLPLKPPIFQCEVGHVVCSSCRDKLEATGKCHVCGVAIGSYRRCHAMERLVESVRVPCPHAAHGCTVRPAYHAREGHRSACPHAPCHCPGEACSFLGSTRELLDHFREAHSWPCTIINNDLDDDNYFFVPLHLHDGFNFVLADCSTANTEQGAGAAATVRCLLLLTVARQPVGRTISVLCIDPHAGNGGDGPAASKEMECQLLYYLPWCFHVNNRRGGNQLVDHHQQSRFRVARTDLSDGMPNPDGCFQIFLPNSVIGTPDRDGIEVSVSVVIK